MSTTKPYLFQSEDAQRAAVEFKGRCLISSHMGLGKSLTALLASEILAANPIIIVCPASLKWNWEYEAKHHLNWSADVLSGIHPPEEGFPYKPKILIINYDILAAGKRGADPERNPKKWPWVYFLKKLKPQIVILDEIHYVSSRISKRSRAVRALCHGVPCVLGLSGTPLTNRPAELWNPLNIINKELFPAFVPFAMAHCAPKLNPYGGWDYTGSKDLDVLHKILTKDVMIRRRKEDVLSQLPPKQRIVVPLEIEDKKQYHRAKHDFLEWIMDNYPSRAFTASHFEALTKGGYLKQLVAELKMKAVTEWVDNFLEDDDGKIILFTVHRKTLQMLHAKYKNISCCLDGSVTGKNRQLVKDKFLNDKKMRILIGQIKAAGVGWSAKGVSATAFIEFAWSPGLHSQAEDRTHGIGRGKEGSVSTCYYLVAKDTIEERLVKILQKKQEVLNAVLDGGQDKGDNMSVFDLLCEELRKDEANFKEERYETHAKNRNKKRVQIS